MSSSSRRPKQSPHKKATLLPRLRNPFNSSVSTPSSSTSRPNKETADSNGGDLQGPVSTAPTTEVTAEETSKRFSFVALRNFSNFLGQRRASTASTDSTSSASAVDPDDLIAGEEEDGFEELAPSAMLLSPLEPSQSEPMPGLERTLSKLSLTTLQENLHGPQELHDVPYSYRVPTPKQAFYDTHMGSSSGWRSLKGRAGDLLHPFGGTSSPSPVRDPATKPKATREKQAATTLVEPSDEMIAGGSRAWTSYLTFDNLPAIPGLSSLSLPSFAGSSSSSSTAPAATDLDLIPKIGPRHPRAREYWSNIKGRNVVILGGYRGSTLRDAKTKTMIWIPMKVGAALRKPTLEMSLDPSAEDTSEDLIIADGMLSRIGKIADLSWRLQRKLERKGANVHSWGFDWRLGLGKSSRRFQDFLLKLYEENSDEPEERRGAIVIAHSMGGLVALHALSQLSDPRAIHTLSFASTPFLGTANILGPLAAGDTTLLNDTICSPRATFSWRSTFYLLPRDGHCFEERDGTRRDLDYLDVETWKWAGLSPVIKSTKLWQDRQRQLEGKTTTAATTAQEATREGQQEEARQAEHASQVPGSIPLGGPQLANASSHDESDDPTASLTGDTIQQGSKAARYVAQQIGEQQDDGPVTLQESNVQDASRSVRRDQDASDQPQDAVIWNYLHRTLAEVRQFDREIVEGFDSAKFESGQYPAITMLTSGRTPTTRGALAGPSEAEQRMSSDVASHQGLSEEDWRSTVTASDYSRMLFAKGDGVISLASSVALPEPWKRCLVQDGEDDDQEEGTAGEGVRGEEKRGAWITESSHRHVSLLSDVDGIGRAVWIAQRVKGKRDDMARQA